MIPVILLGKIAEGVDNFHVGLGDIFLCLQRVLEDSVGGRGQCWCRQSFDQKEPFIHRSHLGQMVRICAIVLLPGSISTIKVVAVLVCA